MSDGSANGSTAEQVRGQAQEAAGKAADSTRQAAGQAREQAQQAAAKARERLRTEADQRSTMAGEQVRQQADDVRSVAESLREQGKDRPAKLAEQAADHAERLGGYLQDADADRLLGDVEDLARRRPWAVMAGGIALGFVASRFLKASQVERYDARAQRPTTGADHGRGYGQGYGTGSTGTVAPGSGAADPLPGAAVEPPLVGSFDGLDEPGVNVGRI